MDPHVWARQQIMEKNAVVAAIPLFYKSNLRFFISRFSELGYMDAEEQYRQINCFHANPERAVAKITQEDNIILPVVSVTQTTSEEDDNRRRQSSNIVVTSFWSKEKQRAYRVISLAPKAITVEYQVNVWCKYKADVDQIAQQIRMMFNPSLRITNDSSESTHAYLKSENDDSTVQTNDREDRIIRKTFNISLEGYISYPKYLITSTENYR